MIIFFTKTLQDKTYATNYDLSDIDLEPRTQIESLVQPMQALVVPTEQPPTTCKYPLNIKELFPYWLRLSSNGNSALISLTQSYYDWLACNAQSSINDVSFFRLEDLINLEYIPDELVKNLSYTYFNAFPSSSIGTYVSPDKIKTLIDNIKINLYSTKGSETSFKLLISDLFGVDPVDVSVTYPKKYILRLNGGRYEWMRDNLNATGDYSVNIDEFYPQLSGSYLNYSVLQDNDVWQEFSYIVNTPGICLDVYSNTVRPVLHPAGTKDIFNVVYQSAGGANGDNAVVTNEISTLANYALYTLGSTASIGHTFGCSGAYGGVTGYPIYTFPSWDIDISGKYYSGMTFGEINIGDFLYLTPIPGNTYPNGGLTCS